MFKKLLTISMLLIFISTLFYAQSTERLILRANGDQIKLESKVDFKEAIKMAKIKKDDGSIDKSSFVDFNFDVDGTLDTLSYPAAGTNFGFFGQDVFLGYFVCPADLTIKAAGFNTSAVDPDVVSDVTLRLIKLNWTYDQLLAVDADFHMGKYPAEGDGFNNIDAFGNKGATGAWIDQSDGAYPLPPWTDNADPLANTFDFDLWSDDGQGFPFVADPDAGYQWVEMILIGEPTLLQNEVFAVVLEHQGQVLDAERIGITAGVIGIPSWKYYENPRSASDPNSSGWWARTYAWDFAVAVELTGDRGPVITDVTNLPTTVSQDARTVSATITDDNPSGGAFGVASAVLSYSTDGIIFTDVTMTADGDVYSADIPGQTPGTEVTYMVSATDVGDITNSSKIFVYSIFLPVEDNLLIFDGQDGADYPEEYYFRKVEFAYDVWAFGPYDEDLLNNYQNVFEITTGGPSFYQREALTNWLAADGTRNYFLAGQEWLGADNGFTNQTFETGSFEYDILGVMASYNDISYAESAGQGLPSLLTPVQGSALGGVLYDTVMVLNPSDSLQYDPVYEIGIDNWMDGFDAVNPANVDLMVETRGIDNKVDVRTIACAVHNVTAAGNKIAFMSMDPIAINSSPNYTWYGDKRYAIQYMAGEWFGVEGFVVGVQKLDGLPNEFKLSQNYPNPFNPTTKIEFSIPKTGLTSLKVYNILGQEVAQLLNKSLTAGSYSVDFDASQLSSGMYIYTIQSGNVEVSKKMMLLK